MDAISLSWVATAYLLSAAAFLVPMGRLGHRGDDAGYRADIEHGYRYVHVHALYRKDADYPGALRAIPGRRKSDLFHLCRPLLPRDLSVPGPGEDAWESNTRVWNRKM
jgi:hypothetical protein